MDTEHPYRAALRRELDALTSEVLAQLDHGHDMPFSADVIEEANDRVIYRRAEQRAASEGHRVTAWLIRRLIR